MTARNPAPSRKRAAVEFAYVYYLKCITSDWCVCKSALTRAEIRKDRASYRRINRGDGNAKYALGPVVRVLLPTPRRSRS